MIGIHFIRFNRRVIALITYSDYQNYLYDDKRVLGTKLDYWKNPRVALSSTSISALIHIEALPPVTSLQLQAMVKETQQLIKTFCGGKSKVVVLDRKKRTASL